MMYLLPVASSRTMAFDGDKAVLKRTLKPEGDVTRIEGVPVEIRFDWLRR